jgi:hypothetical protein
MEKNTERAIVDNMHVDDEGIKVIKTLNIAELQKLGIQDVSSFLSGILHAGNDEEFSDTTDDYVKGYKYGKTGVL